MRINFHKIEERGLVQVVCKECGKYRRRRKIFWQTLNPFNKNEDGTVRTYSEIREVLKDERLAWERSVTLCATCEAQQIEARL